MRASQCRTMSLGLEILLEAQRREDAMHEDVDAFNAPSECHALVSRGLADRLRHARRRIRAATGLTFRQFEREIARRTSAKWAYFNVPPAFCSGDGPRVVP